MFSQRVKFVLVLIFVFALLAGCNASGKQGGQFASIPVGKAWAEGNEIFFSHTEASDKDVASKLTNMMKSPVLFVPSLANVPQDSLAKVYVFENGITGKGPFGFQADVFDSPPQMADQYTPLRNLHLVKWNDNSPAREIKSAAEVTEAEAKGELAITKTGVVINMPFMSWQGGQR